MPGGPIPGAAHSLTQIRNARWVAIRPPPDQGQSRRAVYAPVLPGIRTRKRGQAPKPAPMGWIIGDLAGLGIPEWGLVAAVLATLFHPRGHANDH